MMKFYYHPFPNPANVALFLEECDLPNQLIAVDTRMGEHHLPAFFPTQPERQSFCASRR